MVTRTALVTRFGTESGPAALALWCLAAAQLIIFTLLTLGQPAIDLWGFRTAQTAVAVPYMLREGAWLLNIIPVFGEPWILPIDFPIYVWCVALARLVTGAPIDACGRLVSAAFALATLWPLSILAQEMRLGRGTALLAGALWLAAPVVVFFGRSFLIETTTVFLSVAWLAYYVRFLQTRSWPNALICLVFGVLAALSKITGFAGFTIAGFLYTCWFAADRRRELPRLMLYFFGAAATVLVPVAAFLVWGRLTDSYFLENPLAVFVRFQNLTGLYLGAWEDRFDPLLWGWAVRQRALPEALGVAWLASIYGLFRLGFKRSTFFIALSLIVAYVSAFLMFPKAHMVTHYYQVENALLAAMACAVIVSSLISTGKRLEGFAVLALVVIGQSWNLYTGLYFKILTDDLRQHPYFKAATEINQLTPPTSVIVVFGTGWGADLPYFSDRRGIVIPNWMPIPPIRRTVIDERKKWFGDRPLGAVADCEVYENQRTAPQLIPLRNELKNELGGRTIEVGGNFYGATINPPKCQITLPR